MSSNFQFYPWNFEQHGFTVLDLDMWSRLTSGVFLVDIRAVFEEQLDYVWVAEGAGVMERRAAVIPRLIHHSAVLQQTQRLVQNIVLEMNS